MGNQRRSENTTPEQWESLRLFPGLSACLDSLAKDLDDADAVCKQQLEEGGRITILVPTLDQKSPSVVFVSVREAMLRSVDAPGDETVAAANKIVNDYRDSAGAVAISCFDKMLSVAQSAGSVHTVAPRLAKEVRSRLSGRWEPTNVLRLLSRGGILPSAFSPDDYDVDAYAKNQIRGPVLSRLDSHVQRVLNDATVEEAKANAMAPANLQETGFRTSLFPRSIQLRAIASILLARGHISAREVVDELDTMGVPTPDGWEKNGWTWNYHPKRKRGEIDSMVSKAYRKLEESGRIAPSSS